MALGLMVWYFSNKHPPNLNPHHPPPNDGTTISTFVVEA